MSIVYCLPFSGPNVIMKLIIAILLCAILVQECLSYNSYSGTTRGTFLKWNSGVRSSAMGNAFIGEADDLSAVFFNPSGLSQIDSIYLSSSYSNLFDGMNFASGSIVIPMNKNTFAFSYNYVNFGDIQETTIAEPQGTGKTFTPLASEYIYSLARRFNKHFSIGGNIKIINEDIAGNSSKGYGIDLGGFWKISDVLSIGLSAKNIIGSLGGQAIYKNTGIGISRKIDNMILNLDLNYPSDDNYDINIGTEYNYNDNLYFRFGGASKTMTNYLKNAIAYSGWISDAKPTSSVGIGVKYQKALFDYAYIVYGDLGPTHRIAVSFPLSQKIEAKLTNIEISPKDIEINIGDVITFEAKGFSSRENPVNVTPSWKVFGKIGKISKNGVFTAASTGEGEIIAVANGLKARAQIIVKEPILTGIEIFPDEVICDIGDTILFKAIGFDGKNDQYAVAPAWKVVGGIGKIDQNGNFIAKTPGEGAVIAKFKNLKGISQITVIEPNP